MSACGENGGVGLDGDLETSVRGSMPQEAPVIFASASRVSMTESSSAALWSILRTVAPVARSCSSARSAVTVTTSSPGFRSR